MNLRPACWSIMVLCGLDVPILFTFTIQWFVIFSTTTLYFCLLNLPVSFLSLSPFPFFFTFLPSNLCFRHLYKQTCVRIQLVEEAHSATLNCFTSVSETKTVWSCSKDSNLKVWDVNGQLLKTIATKSDGVAALLSVHPFVLSGGQDKSLMIWNAEVLSRLPTNTFVRLPA